MKQDYEVKVEYFDDHMMIDVNGYHILKLSDKGLKRYRYVGYTGLSVDEYDRVALDELED